ncbi:MAG: hypothetical protein ACFB0B_04610 [Thermonemataceae bacterium]
MGKRQQRVFQAQIVPQRLQLLNKLVQVILRSGATSTGFCLVIAAEQLILKDMKQKQHKILIADIEEIVVDQKAIY